MKELEKTIKCKAVTMDPKSLLATCYRKYLRKLPAKSGISPGYNGVGYHLVQPQDLLRMGELETFVPSFKVI